MLFVFDQTGLIWNTQQITTETKQIAKGPRTLDSIV